MIRPVVRLLPVLALLAPAGCVHRIAKFVAPEQIVIPAEERGEVATVTYTSGWADEPQRAYDPESYDPEPHPGEPAAKAADAWEWPVEITNDGWIDVAPLAKGATARLYVRRMGVESDDLQPVVEITGAIPGRIPNELRFLPVERPLETTRRIAIRDLANPFSERPIHDGDLVLLSVAAGESREHYLFRTRDFGIRTRAGAGILVRLPVPLVANAAEAEADLSPALAATLAIGYRPRTRSPGVEWITERAALVTSIGVGSTSVDTGVGGLQDVSGAFNAALVGGGVELFEFVSAQLLVNLSSFLREGEESNLALAIGFDAVQFARFTDRAVPRLLKKNVLVAPEGIPVEEP